MAFPLYLSYLTSEQKPGAACFVPQSGHPPRPPVSKAMEGGGAAVPVVPMDNYEDMFHEIAKKFYGEAAIPVQGGENGPNPSQNAAQGELGLMDLDYQQVAKSEHYSQSGSQSGGNVSGGTTLLVQTTGGPVLQVTMEASPQSLSDSPPSSKKIKLGLNKVKSAVKTKVVESTWEESEELLSWNSSKVASYNSAHKLFRCLECGCVGFLARVAEHWLGTHTNLRVFQCPRCPYTSAWARCIRMHLARQHNEQSPDNNIWRQNPVLEEVTKFLLNLKNRVENKDESPAVGNSGEKRYTCPYCPYATDRRDLFTRHETIHSEEKPFQCYVCDKQFNRADHCKKHFSRMHREHVYDLQKIKKAANGELSLTSPSAKSNTHVTSNPPTQVPFYTAVAIQNNAANATPTQNNQNSVQPIRPATGTYPHLGLPAFPSQPGANQAYKSYTTLGVEALVRPSHVVASAGNQVSQQQQQQQTPQATSNTSNNSNSQSTPSGDKKKKEKLYACTYCAWRGVDNWCLKRHLNTHIKPYLCVLCDYKAARNERLATHVQKVHNKRICSKCSFVADDQEALTQHVREHHQNAVSKNGRPNKVNSSSNAEPQEQVDDPLHQVILQCELCDFRTSNEATIHVHVAERHAENVHISDTPSDSGENSTK